MVEIKCCWVNHPEPAT